MVIDLFFCAKLYCWKVKFKFEHFVMRAASCAAAATTEALVASWSHQAKALVEVK